MKKIKYLKNEKQSNKGITLIALIVTIIVLILLARNYNSFINK